MADIHPTALVSPQAILGRDVRIGPFCILHEGVVLGDRVRIDAYCELGVPTPLADGSPLIIGDDAWVRSHSVFYTASRFGEKLVTGHRVTVREHTVAGKNFQIGSLADIQGDCTIGDYVRFQSQVFVGKKTTIGNFVWALPHVVLTNDPTPPSHVLDGPTIEDYAVLAAMAVILPGVRVGRHALVAAQACVTRDVAPFTAVAGVPATVLGPTSAIRRRDGSGGEAYPWPVHFRRGYPKEICAQWDTEFAGQGAA